MTHIMKRSTWIPSLLLCYLGVMIYIGRGELAAGRYLYYFGIIATTLVAIWLLRRHLLRAERRRKSRK